MRITLDTTFTDPRLALAGFSDNFNRANGPVVNTPAGKPWRSFAPAGTPIPLVVSGNAAKRGTGGTASRTVWVVDSLLADGHVRATIGSAGDHSFAIAFRVVDENNYYFLEGRPDGSGDLTYRIKRRLAGTASVVASAGTVTSADGDVLDIYLQGSEGTFTINGTVRFGGVKPLPDFVSATNHGILLQAGSSGNESIDAISMTRN